ncbi:MAG: glycosyltransferase family 2 protein [Pseudomonadota bacterium]
MPDETNFSTLTRVPARQTFISVILPMYNEADSIAPLFARLLPILEHVAVSWEVICVDDGSDDATLTALEQWRLDEARIRIIRLSRNFGKEAAVSAGLQVASGAFVLLMDSDLQHPPETLLEMVAKQARGVDIVYGIRRSRKTEGYIRRLLSEWFYRLFSRTSEVPIPANASDFRLLTRRVVDALNALPEHNRFLKGLFAWVGYSSEAVVYDAAPRHSGKSRWSLSKLSGYAWSGIVSFSAAPLRLSSFLGTIIAALALIYAGWIAISTLAFGNEVPGYTTLAVAIFFLGGLQLLSIGILGEYISRIFDETKRRPLFIIEDMIGFEDDG